MGGIGDPAGAAALAVDMRNRALFDDVRACSFGVTPDLGNTDERRVAQSLPDVRWFLDYDRAVAASSVPRETAAGTS